MLTFAITSGKGGVGKTTLCSNLAVALQQAGQNVTVFDADLQLANLDIVCGVDPAFNLQHVVAGEKTLEEVAVKGPGGIRVVTGASAVPSLMAAGPKRMGTFLSQLAALERSADVLLFDTAAGLDNRVLTFLKLSDHVVVVVTPDPTSVTDAYAAIKTLFRRNKDARVSVLMNMADELEARKIYRSIQDVCSTFLKKEVGYVGNVRHDPQAAMATRRRKLFVLEAPGCKASQDVAAVAERLLETSSFDTMPLAS